MKRLILSVIAGVALVLLLSHFFLGKADKNGKNDDGKGNHTDGIAPETHPCNHSGRLGLVFSLHS